ncbi:hypothetical protein [Algibacter sp. 2305UL17-15]|uniref:hypothetical protein n=1 Tax=Algibacter sp. 2305UL17-15 TaxID=3231268 RepID=UPI0034595E24
MYTQDFESPQAIKDFEMTDAKAWRISESKTGNALELFGKSDYKSRVRSPFNIALIKDVVVGDFVFEAALNQTGKEYSHRDLCLFFGATSSTNFYYVHIASKADDHANNIFIVNDAPRKSIGTKTTEGTDWGKTDSWHKVRIEREVASGSIKVYFDESKTPIMEATDVHFTEGRIGIGSFDDTGKFDNIKIWSNDVIEMGSGFFD